MINKLHHYSFTNVPTIFDEEALTVLELCGRLGAKVNEIIEAINKLSGNVTEEMIISVINNVIAEMKDSGNLTEAILEALGSLEDNYLLKGTNEIAFNKKFRVLKERYRYGSEAYKTAYEKTAFSMQSFTYANNNFICGFINSDSTVGRIEERRPDGTLVRYADLNNIGHANSMTAVGNKIYIATLTNDIVVLDYTTFTIDKLVRLPIVLRGIAYDKVSGKLYGVSGQTYYEVDIEKAEVKQLFTGGYITGTFQSFCVHDGVFYEVSSKPEVLTVFRESKLIGRYNIADYSGYDYFGEAEDVEVVNGELYVSSQWQMTSDNYRHNQLWNVPLGDNYLVKVINAPMTLNATQVIFVDSNSTEMCPDGSQYKPFKTLSEGMSVLSSPLAKREGVTDLKVRGTFDDILYARNCNFRVSRWGSDECKITKGIYLQNSTLYIEYIVVTNDDTEDDSVCYAQSSQIYSLNTSFDSVGEGRKYILKFSYTNAICQGKFINTTDNVETPILLYFSKIMGNNESLINSASVSGNVYMKP